ncbi:MAG: DUF6599 family protein [Blastocatellia bacterium]
MFNQQPYHLFPGAMSARVVILSVIILLSVCAAQLPVSAQQASAPKPAPVVGVRKIALPDLAGEWKAAGAARRRDPAQLAAADQLAVWREYGVLSVTARDYVRGKAKVTVAVYETKFPSGAYGLHSFNRGALPAGQNEIQAGPLVIRAGESAADLPAAVAAQLSAQAGADAAELPQLPTRLPEQNKVAASEKYVTGPQALSQMPPFSDLKDVVVFTGGAEAVAAQYDNGGGKMDLLVVDCYTPQLATENLARLRALVDALPPGEKAARLVQRSGNYLIEAVNVRDSAAAKALVEQVKPAFKVYWEGERYSSIPLDKRPPDPLVIAEIRRTVFFLSSSFLLMGLVIAATISMGIMAGFGYFYWRKYQRRKHGFDDSFSDAGGTIRLNLDDHLLTGQQRQARLLGKGN